MGSTLEVHSWLVSVVIVTCRRGGGRRGGWRGEAWQRATRGSPAEAARQSAAPTGQRARPCRAAAAAGGRASRAGQGACRARVPLAAPAPRAPLAAPHRLPLLQIELLKDAGPARGVDAVLALDHELAAQAVEHDGAQALGAPHRLGQVGQAGAVVLNGSPLRGASMRRAARVRGETVCACAPSSAKSARRSTESGAAPAAYGPAARAASAAVGAAPRLASINRRLRTARRTPPCGRLAADSVAHGAAPSRRTVRSMRAHVTPASSSSTSFSTVWHAGPTVMATAQSARREQQSRQPGWQAGRGRRGKPAAAAAAKPSLHAHCGPAPLLPVCGPAGRRLRRRADQQPPCARGQAHSWSWPRFPSRAVPSAPG